MASQRRICLVNEANFPKWVFDLRMATQARGRTTRVGCDAGADNEADGRKGKRKAESDWRRKVQLLSWKRYGSYGYPVSGAVCHSHRKKNEPSPMTDNLMKSSSQTAAPGATHELGVSLDKPALIRENLEHLDRRQWWLGSTSVAVVLLLTLCVASFAFPGILDREETTYSFLLNQAVRALVGLVLLFSVYLVYQQFQITKLRTELSAQIDSLAKVETLASEVYKLAALDQLTGLYNRRSGEQRLAEEMSRAQRHGRPLTILLMDLDGLKTVNDKHGHAAGDTVIKSFADRLQRAIRGSDLAVRLGGDEFMAILPECKCEEVDRVLGRIEGLDFEFDEQKIRLRFSRGWTDFRPIDTMQEFLRRADVALYEDKRAAKRASEMAIPGVVTAPQAAN